MIKIRILSLCHNLMARRILRKNAKRTRRPRRALRRSRPRSARVGPVRTVVRKELARLVETKSAQYGGGRTFSTVDDPQWEYRNVITCSPGTEAGYNIVVGGQDSQRIGNKIRTKRVVFRGVFLPLPYGSSVNPYPAPLEVVLWLVKVKGTSFEDNQQMMAQHVATEFLEQNNSFVPLQGNLADLVYPINKNSFTVCGSKRFKLGWANYGGQGGQNAQQYFANNDFKYNKVLTWDLTKHVDKVMVWNDNTATEPSNKKLYIVMEALRADGGTTNLGTGWDACNLNYRIDYDYTDS